VSKEQERDMRRLAIAAFMVGLLPLTAFAQNKTPMQTLDDEKKQQHADTEKAYQDALKRLRASSAPAAPVDPWQAVRPAPATSDASKK
jgi:hypothetical protein